MLILVPYTGRMSLSHCHPKHTAYSAGNPHADLHTIVDRLEAAGWGDALSDGKKHGVDIGKLHEAAMFYLPSKRPDCFLMHIKEGRKPLDPSEWVSHIPDDLLISPPPPVPPEIYQHGDTPAHKDKRVEWAIDYWRKCGCVRGKGRTQLWLLAKRLAEAGCVDAEMRVILHEQAGFATNPRERREEIEGVAPRSQCYRCKVRGVTARNIRTSGDPAEEHRQQEFLTPSSAAPAVASASQQFPPAAPSGCARPAFAPCPRSAPPGLHKGQHRQGKPY